MKRLISRDKEGQFPRSIGSTWNVLEMLFTGVAYLLVFFSFYFLVSWFLFEAFLVLIWFFFVSFDKILFFFFLKIKCLNQRHR